VGWNSEQRRAYFSWLNLAESKYKGGASFQLFIQQVRKDAVAKLTDAEKAEYKDVIEGRQNIEVVKLETTRQFIHNWQMEDFADKASQAESGRSFEKGKLAYEAAQCAKCHRFRGEGASTGPDITAVGNRFNSQYVLESLIVPSKVVSDQYVNSVVVTDDGEVLTGRIIEEDAQKIRIRTSPFALELTDVLKAKVEQRQLATISEMPVGLVNVLTQEEVLDLVAYLRSGGDPGDKAFKKQP
jgi:putative heme-binding domain-containing protein